MRFGDERIRVVSPGGRVTADTGPLSVTEEEAESPAHANWLYRLGAAILKKPETERNPFERQMAWKAHQYLDPSSREYIGRVVSSRR